MAGTPHPLGPIGQPMPDEGELWLTWADGTIMAS
jgi:hypothetical protein